LLSAWRPCCGPCLHLNGAQRGPTVARALLMDLPPVPLEGVRPGFGALRWQRSGRKSDEPKAARRLGRLLGKGWRQGAGGTVALQRARASTITWPAVQVGQLAKAHQADLTLNLSCPAARPDRLAAKLTSELGRACPIPVA